jgi:GH15 family glucan-1,4-alpha-glucosidase
VVGNCQVAALIDNRAGIVWACLPRPDGDPVFHSLLSGHGVANARGSFSVDLFEFGSSTQTYIRNTAVLETILRDSRGGGVRITDFCPRFRNHGRMYRPMMLIRIIEPFEGRPVVRLGLHPGQSYGASRSSPRCGTHSIRFAADGVDYRVTTDASLSAILEERPLVLDRPVVFILGPDETVDDSPAVFAQTMLARTLLYWQDWVRTLAVPYDWQEAVIRAAITLKLCTFEDSGAVLAALTTSIPESPDSGRNWDYRYCWLRDSYFVIQALNRLGATRTMEAYLQYLDQVVAGQAIGELQPLYTIGGGSDMEERIIETLPGFCGMGPVRVGNLAARQTQHDVYGSVVLAITQMFFDDRLMQRGDRALFERMERLGERAAALYDQPDSGPWELRGKSHVHTFSATMSWAGCDRLARIADRLGIPDAERRWRHTADAMRARILTGAWNARLGCFVGTFGGSDIDATVLLLAELGLVSPTDPRFLATVDVVGEKLRVGDHLYRYRHADDFGEPETAFTICSFWYVNALAMTGRMNEAREQFTRLLEMRNPLGLLSEDMDTRTGTLWGNYPQTYSLVGIINSALRLSRSWDSVL